MNDPFLIRFALCTLVVISFVLQHSSQIIYRKISSTISRDKNATYIFIIITMQLASVAILMEMMRYALNK
jgi:hypothetical protein